MKTVSLGQIGLEVLAIPFCRAQRHPIGPNEVCRQDLLLKNHVSVIYRLEGP